MPKKPPRNAFYFYMIDFKEEQRKKGINYQNMAAVAEAAGPAWKNAPPAVRTKFEELAKKEKQKMNVPEMKYTSTGISFAEIERREKEQREAVEREQKDIINKVKSKAFSGDIKEEEWYIMDVNSFCQTGSGYVIGESTLLRFSLADGIQDDYHENINPGYIPKGYGSDAKLACVEFGMEMPDETERRTNYIQVLANIMDYLRVKDPSSGSVLPIIYTMPDKVAPVQNFIQQLCNVSAQNEARFRVYRLDTLFFHLINAFKTREDEGFPKESLALLQLKKDMFKYNPGLGCDHHENETEKSIECTRSRVKRWAYTILDHCCPVAGVQMCPGKHVPQEYNMESILVHKEQSRVRAVPSVAMSSCNSSMVNDSVEQSPWPTIIEGVSSACSSRTAVPLSNEPLREPKINYASRIKEAPMLSERDFPKLTIGVGRGRGSHSSLNK